MDARKNLHVVIFPWSAFGHLIPFLQLSIALAKAGVKVSFISTPGNIRRLSEIPSNLATLIELVAFKLPALDDEHLLPEGSEATVDVASDKIPYLKIAYDLLHQPVKRFILENRPDWILIDVIPHWVAEIAQETQIPLINFSVYAATVCSFLVGPSSLTIDPRRIRSSPESLTSPPEWYDFPSSLACPSFLATGIYEGLYGENASGIRDIDRFSKVVQASEALAIRTCSEFEAEYLNCLEKSIGKAVIPIGLLLPEKPDGEGRTMDKPWTKIFEWLDLQTPKSVIFVGFGSECKLRKQQIHEIAYGLELSGLPFLWALRKPEWARSELDVLPLGFSDSRHGKGLVSFGWAPQLEILGHPSIGGSMFHAGWGSVIETLQFGHCLVVLPFVYDQPLNAKLLVEKGLAIEIERNEDGSFSRDAIGKALRLAMVSKGGEALRGRSREAARVFGNRDLQNCYFDNFVEYLKKKGAANHR